MAGVVREKRRKYAASLQEIIQKYTNTIVHLELSFGAALLRLRDEQLLLND
ncbi:hypothetical protein PB1_12999 [Bacillus methanolicus PB1]|uniref:Uncharacterized protein n=1 Tax=Bacillus methanolicus PB1 TaxID=997296 RepID=I3DW55_BACMT|nr:hypothetical protein PB1_12999 [Bacillus methanolicus PB1]